MASLAGVFWRLFGDVRSRERPRFLFFSALATLLGLIAAGCSQPTQVSGRWEQPGYADGPFSRILVVGVSENAGRRRRFENEMAAKLDGEKGRTVWASYATLPEDATLDRPTIEAEVKKLQADSVIVTRLVSEQIRPEQTADRVGVDVVRKNEEIYDFFRYDYNEYVDPGELKTVATVQLATDVYEAADGQLIYRMSSTSFEVESEYQAVEEAAKAIAKQLRKEGLIR